MIAKRTIRMLLLVTLVLQACTASAGFVETPTAAVAAQLQDKLDQIASARGLSAQDARLAKLSASAWVYGGPCSMPVKAPTLSARFHDAAQAIISPRPDIPFHAAFLEMVAVLTSENLGREMPKWICDFVSSIAHAD